MIKMTGKWWKIFASIGGTIASFSQLPWLVLDPQMKLQALQFYYLKLDHITCEEKVGVVKSKMYKFWWVCESKFHFIEYINKFSTCSFSWTKFQFRGNPRDGRIRSIGCKLIDLLISYILCLLIIWYLVFINVFCLSYNVMGIYQSCEWKC